MTLPTPPLLDIAPPVCAAVVADGLSAQLVVA